MQRWAAVAVALLKLLADIFSAKKVAEAKEAGKAEAVLASVEAARRSIAQARAIEKEVEDRRRKDPTDGAFDPGLFRD